MTIWYFEFQVFIAFVFLILEADQFGTGMACLLPGSRIGEYPSCIRPTYGSERAKLINLRAVSVNC